MKCTAYPIGTLPNLKYVVTFALYQNKWLVCKHKARNTWEISGGHIEPNETAENAAFRELIEETGAAKFTLEKVCDYWACEEPHEGNKTANGQVFLAKITEMGEISEKSEMAETKLIDNLHELTKNPTLLTYPDITSTLLPVVLNFHFAKNPIKAHKTAAFAEETAFAELANVMDILLSDYGCPWDRVQTHETLRENVIEEAYEVADAIDNHDLAGLQEELGDLLLQVILHARISEKNGENNKKSEKNEENENFTLQQLISKVTEKLVTRHSHIFGADSAASQADALSTWESNKLKEKSIKSQIENMQAVPQALPALIRAQKVAKRSGEKFNENESIDEIIEVLTVVKEKFALKQDLSQEFGKILFLTAILCNFCKINAEFSLTNSLKSFITSFSS